MKVAATGLGKRVGSRHIGVTRATHGVLFLDELAEFIAPVIDGLRNRSKREWCG